MKPLIFPPGPPGTGETLPGRLTVAAVRRWERLAFEMDARTRPEGRPTVAALLRAIGAGEVVLMRKGILTQRAEEQRAEEPPPVHRGCPMD